MQRSKLAAAGLAATVLTATAVTIAATASAQSTDIQALRALLPEITPPPWRVEQGVSHLEIRAPHQTERSVARVYCDIDAAYLTLAANVLPSPLHGGSGTLT